MGGTDRQYGHTTDTHTRGDKQGSDKGVRKTKGTGSHYRNYKKAPKNRPAEEPDAVKHWRNTASAAPCSDAARSSSAPPAINLLANKVTQHKQQLLDLGIKPPTPPWDM